MEVLKSEVGVHYWGVIVRDQLFMPKVKVWYSLEVHVRGQYMILRSSSCSSHKSVLVFMESLISVWYEGVQVRGPFVHFNIKQQWFDILGWREYYRHGLGLNKDSMIFLSDDIKLKMDWLPHSYLIQANLCCSDGWLIYVKGFF